MCYYSINYTITSTFSDDGFVTDAKTTPTLFESLQKMTEDCTQGLLPVPFLSSMYFIWPKTLDRLTSIYS